MTTEQKAKAYDEALELAKFYHGNCPSESERKKLEKMFPELADSEDERIRKVLCIIVDEMPLMDTELRAHGLSKERVLAWLEKQKEQKHHDGCFTCDEYKKGYEEGRRNGFTAGYNKAMKEVEQKEQKPAEWSDKDEKVYDYLKGGFEYATNNPNLLNSVLSGASDATIQDYRNFIDKLKILRPQPKQEWSEIEVAFRGEKVKVKRAFFRDDKGRGYSTTEQDDEVTWNALRAWAESHGYTPFELYPREEWSEEDEDMKRGIICALSGGLALTTKEQRSKMLDWLKSLRPQPEQNVSDMITPNKEFFQWIYNRLVYVHKENPNVDYMISFKRRIEELPFDEPSWKPSEEQLKALLNAEEYLREGDQFDSAKKIAELYEQLKAIKEDKK